MSETVGSIEDLLTSMGISEDDKIYSTAKQALSKRDKALYEHLRKKTASELIDDESGKADVKKLEKELVKRESEINKLKEELENLDGSPAVQAYVRNKVKELEKDKQELVNRSKQEITTQYQQELDKAVNFGKSEKAKRQQLELALYSKKYAEGIENSDIFIDMLVKDGYLYMKESESENGIIETPALKPIKIKDATTGAMVEKEFTADTISDGLKAVLQTNPTYSRLFRLTEKVNTGTGTVPTMQKQNTNMSDLDLARAIANGKIPFGR